MHKYVHRLNATAANICLPSEHLIKRRQLSTHTTRSGQTVDFLRFSKCSAFFKKKKKKSARNFITVKCWTDKNIIHRIGHHEKKKRVFCIKHHAVPKKQKWSPAVATSWKTSTVCKSLFSKHVITYCFEWFYLVSSTECQAV